MSSEIRRESDSRQEVEDLRLRLEEAEDTLRAIRSGQVDALVVTGPQGYQVYTLKGAEQPYRIFIEQMKEGAATVTPEGTILYCNPRFADMVATPLEHAIGSSIYGYVAPPHHEEFAALMRDWVESGKKQEMALLGRHGVHVPVYLSASRLVVDGVEAVCIVATDLTEQKRNEETVAAERHRADEERIRANKLESLGILAGGLAHDFNNFLASILGNVSLVKRSMDPNNDLYDRLSQAETACLQARNLTQQLLTFARGGSPVKKATSITALLRESASFALRGSNIRPKFTIPGNLWPLEVDEGQISRVISNLVINAEQAMPDGGVIRVKAENISVERNSRRAPQMVRPGDYVRITVSDSGTGIPKEHLERIFDPYFTTKDQGSGLGLATTYSIVKSHSGYINVESELGAGTTFYIYLPASSQPVLLEEPQKESDELRGVSVLVMDDQEAIREVLSHMLSELGCEVALARNGTEAIQMYTQAQEAGRPYDVVLMDLTVPGAMGGREAISELREIDPQVKAVVLSGYSNSPVMSQYAEYGFSGVVNKPFEMDELQTTLSEVLSKPAQTSANGRQPENGSRP